MTETVSVTGNITGTVNDPKGAVVSEAVITTINEATGISKPVITRWVLKAKDLRTLQENKYDSRLVLSLKL